MPTYVKTATGDKLIKNAWVKVGGIWKATPTIHVKIGEAWKQVHEDLVTFVFSASISGTVYNYNMYSALVAAGWNQIDIVQATITINAGAIVSSTSTTTYAFTTGSTYYEGSTLTLINNGKILGKGGKGGAGSNGDASPEAGGFAGPALLVGLPCTLTNNGTIAGGGGGGAGGRTMRVDTGYDGTFRCVGGGAGAGVGVNSGGAAYSSANPSSGTVYAGVGGTSSFTAAGGGGAGASGTFIWDFQTWPLAGERGGSGGAYASAGALSAGGNSASGQGYKTGSAVAVGAGGAALSGNSFITYVTVGSIFGVAL